MPLQYGPFGMPEASGGEFDNPQDPQDPQRCTTPRSTSPGPPDGQGVIADDWKSSQHAEDMDWHFTCGQGIPAELYLLKVLARVSKSGSFEDKEEGLLEHYLLPREHRPVNPGSLHPIPSQSTVLD